MKKLIELLNEYEVEKEKFKGNNTYFRWDKGEYGIARYDYLDMYEGNNLLDDSAIPYIISKQFGFIKWLVDNDKIDESKIEIHWFSFYESVLMELAIQDNPIEFLISVLR